MTIFISLHPIKCIESLFCLISENILLLLGVFFFFSVVFSCMFQVLQQECVEMECLNEVDASGKTLLDRLGMAVIFPDG